MTAAAESDPHAPNAAAHSEPPAKIDRPAPLPRSRYRRFVPLATRWTDNDAYGHLNNVVYLSLFDSAVNAELVGAGVLDIEHGAVIGLVVETGCHFFASLAFPQALEAGLAVARIGRTSVSYEIGIFATGATETAAHGRFVHVYVDRQTRRPVPLPDRLLAFVKVLQ
jgi:acyl-CoA thioester hydrolase